MKRTMALAFAMSLGLFALTGAQEASATVADPAIAAPDANTAQEAPATKVQWRRYGHRGWRPGYGWAPLAALGVAAAATAGAYSYYGPGPYYPYYYGPSPYYGPGPYYYGPGPYPYGPRY